jgi:hypothetical protein
MRSGHYQLEVIQMIRRALVFSLCLLLGDEAVSPDLQTSALSTVVASFDGGRLRDYAFSEKPVCYPDAQREECLSHSQRDLDQIRLLLANETPKDGWSFSFSPVRNSGFRKVVELYASIDPVEPGYGCVVTYRVVLDRSGSEIVSSNAVMSDLFVSQRR